MIKPISPDEVKPLKLATIPDVVFAVVNDLIVKNWNQTQAIFSQDAIVEELKNRDPSMTNGYIFENHFLDFEEAYRAAGWKVIYDKPGYNESYAATFQFTKDKNKTIIGPL